MTQTERLLIVAIAAVWVTAGHAQILSRTEAAKLALAHNYDIQMALNEQEIAENNAGRMNSGYLPTASTQAGANLNYNAGENKLIIGDQKFDPRASVDCSASMSVNYVIMDNNGRRYNYASLKENHRMSELQARQVIENTLINLAGAYFDIAMLTENTAALNELLEVSEKRHQRAVHAFEVGQGTQIAVLNALVDFNNDSIALLNTQRELENAKRSFNLILGRDLALPFEPDTSLNFQLMPDHAQLLQLALDKNARIEQTQSQLRNSAFAIEAGKAGWFPALSANVSYNFRGLQDPNGAFVTASYAYGPRAGLALSWNLFDGGRTSTRVQNAKIQMETQRLTETQTTETAKRDLINTHASYNNALFVIQVQKTNLKAARQSFERSEEQHKLGLITALEFRQIQVNLLNATLGLSTARYNAKNLEYRVKQLCGVLIEEF